MMLQLEAFTSDGGIDIYHAINLSGEPLMDRVKVFYGDEAKPGVSGDKIHATNLKLRQYQKEYLDYWNSTASMTSTRRPVDAVLCPVAPTPAFEIGKTASVCEALHIRYRYLIARLLTSAHSIHSLREHP